MTPEDLVEIREIEQLKYHYVRCVDLKLWDEVGSLFVPDARAEYGGGAYVFDGREAIVGFLRATMSSTEVLTSHKCHQPEISVEPGADTATATWALEDVVVRRDYEVTIQGAAYYYDTYRKVDGTWLFASTGYKRVYEEVFPRSSIEGLRLTGDYWSTGGRSKLQAQ